MAARCFDALLSGQGALVVRMIVHGDLHAVFTEANRNCLAQACAGTRHQGALCV